MPPSSPAAPAPTTTSPARPAPARTACPAQAAPARASARWTFGAPAAPPAWPSPAVRAAGGRGWARACAWCMVATLEGACSAAGAFSPPQSLSIDEPRWHGRSLHAPVSATPACRMPGPHLLRGQADRRAGCQVAILAQHPHNDLRSVRGRQPCSVAQRCWRRSAGGQRSTGARRTHTLGAAVPRVLGTPPPCPPLGSATHYVWSLQPGEHTGCEPGSPAAACQAAWRAARPAVARTSPPLTGAGRHPAGSSATTTATATMSISLAPGAARQQHHHRHATTTTRGPAPAPQ